MRPTLCVGLCLKNQNMMCKVVCSRPCLFVVSAYVGARGRGLASDACFVCAFVFQTSKYYVYISLL